MEGELKDALPMDCCVLVCGKLFGKYRLSHYGRGNNLAVKQMGSSQLGGYI